MKRIEFWKMSGSGNDFVMVDNRRRLIRGGYSVLARRLCHRQFGIGADGLLLLESDPKTAFRMVYYNADGSRADMCGNGARCMAWFAHARKAAGTDFTFRTDAYPVKAALQGNVVEVSLGAVSNYKPEVNVTVDGKVYRPAFLNTGVPHAVLFVPDADQVLVGSLGRALRFHKAFGPRGTNVNFVQKLGPNKLKVRTYERGVEGETLACGTGVAASAVAAALKGIVKAPVLCTVAGGDTLQVRFQLHPDNPNRPATAMTLRGPVRLTFKGEIYV